MNITQNNNKNNDIDQNMDINKSADCEHMLWDKLCLSHPPTPPKGGCTPVHHPFGWCTPVHLYIRTPVHPYITHLGDERLYTGHLATTHSGGVHPYTRNLEPY